MKNIIVLFFAILFLMVSCKKSDDPAPAPDRDTMKDSLIAWYKLDGNTADSSGNSHHGTVFGTPVSSVNRHGQPGYSLSFDGVDDYINCGNFIGGLDSLTISLWVNIGNYSNVDYMTPLAQATPTFPFTSYPFTFYTATGVKSTGFQGFWNANPTSDFDLRTDGNLGVKYWHHLLITFDGTTIKQYINSAIDKSITVPAGKKIGNTYPLLIAKGYAYPAGSPLVTSFFSGKIDDIRIYKRVLRPAEILKLDNE